MDSASLAHRHQEALSIAEHCAEVLQKQFGAKQVIPFGSLHPCFRGTSYPTQMNIGAFAIGFATFTDTNWNQRG